MCESPSISISSMEVSRQLGLYWLVLNQPPSVAESK
jgi:hypothetical protein